MVYPESYDMIGFGEVFTLPLFPELFAGLLFQNWSCCWSMFATTLFPLTLCLLSSLIEA